MTLEIVEGVIESAMKEIEAQVERTARSTNIREANDHVPAIFDASGPKPSDGWEADTVTPGGVYLLQTKGPRSRVYAPSTGEQWSYYAGEDNRGGDATMDGRYALSYFTPDFAPQAARNREIGRAHV